MGHEIAYDAENRVKQLLDTDDVTVEQTQQTHDGGTDLYVQSDEADPFIVKSHIQVKYRSDQRKVDPQTVRKTASLCADTTVDATHIVLATNSQFTEKAKEDAKDTNVTLWNGEKLDQIAVENGYDSFEDDSLGQETHAKPLVEDIDEEQFQEFCGYRRQANLINSLQMSVGSTSSQLAIGLQLLASSLPYHILLVTDNKSTADSTLTEAAERLGVTDRFVGSKTIRPELLGHSSLSGHRRRGLSHPDVTHVLLDNIEDLSMKKSDALTEALRHNSVTFTTPQSSQRTMRRITTSLLATAQLKQGKRFNDAPLRERIPINDDLLTQFDCICRLEDERELTDMGFAIRHSMSESPAFLRGVKEQLPKMDWAKTPDIPKSLRNMLQDLSENERNGFPYVWMKDSVRTSAQISALIDDYDYINTADYRTAVELLPFSETIRQDLKDALN